MRLKAKKIRRKRNKLVVALLLPALVLIWLVGWSLYWVGHQKEAKPKPRPRQNANIELIIAETLENELIKESA